MKLVVAIVIAATCAAAFALGAPLLSPEQKNTLTTFDQVLTRPQLDQSLGSDALGTLASIASDSSDPSPDGDAISIRLRAIHALAKYCTTSPCASSDLAHTSVTSVVAATRNATSGSQVLLLRASIETLGAMRVTTDASSLTPLLDHPSRDIRAATARALRDLCNNQAIPPLRARYSAEMTDQVKLAISEALRILGQCGAL